MDSYLIEFKAENIINQQKYGGRLDIKPMENIKDQIVSYIYQKMFSDDIKDNLIQMLKYYTSKYGHIKVDLFIKNIIRLKITYLKIVPKCWGCYYDRSGQKSHMEGPDGCLYDKNI